MEHKYKVGDEVAIKAEIVSIDTDDSKYPYKLDFDNSYDLSLFVSESQLRPVEEETCKWSRNPKYDPALYFLQSSCGLMPKEFMATKNNIVSLGFKCCPYCGRKIEVVE